MIKESKFFTGGLNADKAYQAFSDTDLVNVFNAVFSSNRDGKAGRLEFIPGTRGIGYAYPGGNGFIIGSAVDIPKRRIYFFRYNSSGSHGIYCLDETGIKKVIENSNVTGGLDFDDDKLINGARVVGDVLYWNQPGTYNGQRKINVEAALKASNPFYTTSVSPYTFPVNKSVITLYRKQPSFAPSVVKVTQSSPVLTNNYVVKEAFQFAIRFTYRDGEESKLSPYSKLAATNRKVDTFNAIDVTLSASEPVDQDVQSVDVLVRYGNSGGFFVVKSWDKRKTADAAEIAAHPTTPLRFRFYNDQVGLAVPESYSTAQFDSIPIQSETLEFLKNRIFLGNNIEGYSSPQVTSLQTTTVAAGAAGGSYTATWWKLDYTRLVLGLPTPDTMYLLQIIGGPQTGWYATATLPNELEPPLPTTIAWSGLVFVAEIYYLVEEWMFANWNAISVESFSPTAVTPVTVTGIPPSSVNDGVLAFKSGATYQGGIVFTDEHGRKCGVVPGAKLSIPDRDYGFQSYIQNLAWSLSSTSMAAEIPDWAYYYYPVITNCLTTRFFMQRKAVSMTYVTKDADGQYLFATSAYAPTNVGIGVDISDLSSIGYGYSYQNGDIIKLYKSDNTPPVSLSVVGLDGRWLICELANMGTLNSGTAYMYEIYTPYVSSLNEFFYEVGDVYRVNNPGTISRSYSTLGGTFRGDVFLVKRGDTGSEYMTEAMANNDKVWTRWFTDAGRPNIIDNIGQRVKKSNISFSNTRIPETGINGLSSFNPLDESNEVPAEAGPIRKIIAASRTVSDGTVMLCLCEADTASIYVGEVQVRDNAGQSLLSTSDGVIGTINVLRGGFGTVNPESVQSWNGNVFWWDLNRGSVVMYGGNGLERISEFGQATTFKKFSDDYRAWITGEFFPRVKYPGKGYVIGHINPNDGSYYITLPKLFWDTKSVVFSDMVLQEL